MKNILYISLVDWFWIKQRPHHIPEILSKSNKVTYFCIKSWKKNTNTANSHGDDDSHELNKSVIEKGNLTIRRLQVLPLNNKYTQIEQLNNRIIKSYLSKLVKKNKYDYIIVTNPNHVNFLSEDILRNNKVIYDCMDNYSEFKNKKSKGLFEDESKLVSFSYQITVSSDDLKNKMLDRHKDLNPSKITVVNNGVDTKTFVPQYNKTVKNRIGYVGTISDWFDFELIKKSATKNKNYEYYIVGPTEVPHLLEELSKISNVKIIGSKPYYEVPDIVSEFDVCIMPFTINELVKSVNPVKIYEYLAMDKPVISVKYEETLKFKNYIYLYETFDEFEEKLKEALNEEGSNKARIEFAAQNSWNSRAKQIELLFK